MAAGFLSQRTAELPSIAKRSDSESSDDRFSVNRLEEHSHAPTDWSDLGMRIRRAAWVAATLHTIVRREMEIKVAAAEVAADHEVNE